MTLDRLRFVRLAATIALVLAAPSLTMAQEQAGDPPARVGRLARIAGTVSFHLADQDQWAQASLNYPVTSGNSFWTEPKSNAALEVGVNRIYLDGSSEFDLGTLNEESLVASLPQGAVFLSLATASSDDQYEIDTPRGTVNVSEAGGYEIRAGDTDNPTIVTVLKGSAEFVANNVHLTVGPRQSAVIWGSDQLYMSTAAAQDDDFVRYVRAQERPYLAAQAAPPPAPANQQRPPQPARQPAPAAPGYTSQAEPDNQPPPEGTAGYAPPAMTGYQDLDRYGRWRETPSYGRVWFPEVRSGWAPYRDGHWAYIQPWGWTWIDDAPWGFTPFHYGRWVQVDHQWAWTPGQSNQRPVYAPAVVNFIGGVNVNGGTGSGSGGAVGWVPLGPGEAYVPPYKASPGYVRNVNVNNVGDVTKIDTRNTTNVTTINQTVVNNYVNQSAVTVVPTTTMTNSRPVAAAARQIPVAQLDKSISASPAPPVKPTMATAGMTPTLARNIGAEAAPATAAPPIPPAPGPALESGAGQKPGKHRGKPPLLVGSGATSPVVGGPAQPGASGSQTPPAGAGAPVVSGTDQGGKPRKPPVVASTETPPAGGDAGKPPAPQAPPKPAAGTAVPEADQIGKPPVVALTETPPAGGDAKPAAPGPQIAPKPAAGTAVPETDQTGKPRKPGKPPVVALTETPPAGGDAGKPAAPGAQIAPKPAAGTAVPETGQTGKPPVVALTETPPAGGDAGKSAAPGPQIAPKPAAGTAVPETDQTGKPRKPGKPPVVALTEPPPAGGDAGKPAAPGPQIAPKPAAGTAVPETDQTGKPRKSGKPPVVASTEPPPAGGDAGKPAAPGPQIAPKPAAGTAVPETDQAGKPPTVAVNEPPPAGGDAGKPAAPGPQIPPKNAAAAGANQDAGQQLAAAPNAGCRVKGNIAQSGERTYLMPGDRRYDKTRIDTAKGERWFCSEAEAQAAGWHRAKQ